jgi:TPR repeat protein
MHIYLTKYIYIAFCYLNGNGTAANIMQASFWFRKAADELNDSISLFHLAEIYGSGVEMHTDIELALACLKKSADLGYSEAQFRMGKENEMKKKITENGYIKKFSFFFNYGRYYLSSRRIWSTH